MKTFTLLNIALGILLSGCGSQGTNTTSNAIALSTQEKLGEALFFDVNLSLTKNTSCATCHDSEHAFMDARFHEAGVDQNIFINGAFSVGDDGSALGGRNTPTAAYAMFSPTFYKMGNGNYKGGQFHNGRAKTLEDQAGRPPLDLAEMMMSDKNTVVDRIKENEKYVEAFETLYGKGIFDDINTSYKRMEDAIAAFERTELFAPFDSRYDRYRECKDNGGLTSQCLSEGNWTIEEQLGFDLFFSESNTNCAQCHTLNNTRNDTTEELFTNYEYENIGTPRNVVAMNAREALGLQDANATFKGLGATVEATDGNYSAHLGKTKVPTLRNVAVTGPYMNNGVFQKLRTVLEFYDHMAGNGDHPNNPETNALWGENDHNSTIDFIKLHDTSALTDAKIRALEAFLNTLTDKKYENLIPPLAPEGEVGN